MQLFYSLHENGSNVVGELRCDSDDISTACTSDESGGCGSSVRSVVVTCTAHATRWSACWDRGRRGSRSISRATGDAWARSRAGCGWWTRTGGRGRTLPAPYHRRTTSGSRSPSSSSAWSVVVRTCRSRTPAESTRETLGPDPCTCCGTTGSICNGAHCTPVINYNAVSDCVETICPADGSSGSYFDLFRWFNDTDGHDQW